MIFVGFLLAYLMLVKEEVQAHNSKMISHKELIHYLGGSWKL